MSPTTQGMLVLVVTLAMLLSGVPVAFGLGLLSLQYVAEIIAVATHRQPPISMSTEVPIT